MCSMFLDQEQSFESVRNWKDHQIIPFSVSYNHYLIFTELEAKNLF